MRPGWDNPAAAPTSASNCAKFTANFLQMFANPIGQFCRKRSFANTSRIGFNDTQNIGNIDRTNASANAS